MSHPSFWCGVGVHDNATPGQAARVQVAKRGLPARAGGMPWLPFRWRSCWRRSSRSRRATCTSAEVNRQLIVRPRGLLLVTGPTGSGKTTSLASMVDFINTNYDRHIITLEDPIEYYHKHKKCTVNQREIGIDVPDFKEGIRRALRMDPDIILVGEMRDLETIHAAIEAAETGHVVFGTLHTSGAASTINRIIDVFPKEQQDQIRTQLSTALIGVLSQTLLPKKPDGLVAAYEMLVVTPAIQNLIRENKTYRIDSSIQTGRKH